MAHRTILRENREGASANGYFVQNEHGATVAGPFENKFQAWAEQARLDGKGSSPEARGAALLGGAKAKAVEKEAKRQAERRAAEDKAQELRNEREALLNSFIEARQERDHQEKKMKDLDAEIKRKTKEIDAESARAKKLG
jgi:hypothetical protein